MPKINSIGEFSLIETYFRPLTGGHSAALDLLDDAAILSFKPGRQVVVTMDALCEGTHFFKATAPDDLAFKVLGVNLSDIAAMGANPFAYTLALTLPKSINEDWISRFTAGLSACQSAHDIFLAGGDTTSTDGPLVVSISAFGTVAEAKALVRNGASVNDDLYVSGTIGDAALGLIVEREVCRLSNNDEFLQDRYRRPQPRTGLGPKLIGVASACIDVSDGLIADVGHLCAASGVAADILVNSVPLSSAAADAMTRAPEYIEPILTGGDDYELAFTVPVAKRDQVAELSEELEIQITRIGHLFEGEGVYVKNAQGKTMSFTQSGYRHF